MSPGSIRITGYLIASLLLIGLSRVMPGVAVALAIAITTGVLLTHNQEFVVLANRIVEAYGMKQTGQSEQKTATTEQPRSPSIPSRRIRF